jgi:hypothetical protein
MTDEQLQLQDGLAFYRLLQDEKMAAALERLCRRLNDDAIGRWEQDKTPTKDYSKKWLKGSREMAGCFLPAIKQMAQDSMDESDAAREAETLMRSSADDGMGSGDLSIA